MKYHIVAYNYNTYQRFIRNFGFTPTAAEYLYHFPQIRGTRQLYIIFADGWESRNDLSDLLVELRLQNAKVLEHSIFSKAMIIPEKFIPIAEFFSKKLKQYEDSAKEKLQEDTLTLSSAIQQAHVKSSFSIAEKDLKILEMFYSKKIIEDIVESSPRLVARRSDGSKSTSEPG